MTSDVFRSKIGVTCVVSTRSDSQIEVTTIFGIIIEALDSYNSSSPLLILILLSIISHRFKSLRGKQKGRKEGKQKGIAGNWNLTIVER